MPVKSSSCRLLFYRSRTRKPWLCNQTSSLLNGHLPPKPLHSSEKALWGRDGGSHPQAFCGA